jgi:hypothetical protein
MVCAAKGMLAPHAAATPHSRRVARDASTKRDRRLRPLSPAARERGGDAAPACSSPGRAGAPRRRSASRFLPWPRGSAEATQRQPAPPLAARERRGDAAPAGSSPGRAGARRQRSASRLLPWPRGSAEATQRQPAPPLAARERGGNAAPAGSSPGRAGARLGEVARAKGARRRGHVFPSRQVSRAKRSASHRQSRCPAPGRQRNCPPRRRAAARRHPSHPR